MNERKTKKVTEKDYAALQRIKAYSEEDKQRNRLETIETNSRHIKHMERARDHKKGQVKEGVSVEVHPGYKDFKPIFMLENEVEEIQSQIEQIKKINKTAQEEYDKGG